MDQPRNQEPLRRAQARVFLSLALFSASATGTANSDVAVVRLNYDAPESCPQKTEFEERVRARSPSIHLTNDEQTGRALQIAVIPLAGGYVGSLRLIEEDGAERLRTLRARRCIDVVDGLALMTAVALNPDAPDVPRAQLQSPVPALPRPVTTTSVSWHFTGGAAGEALFGLAPGRLFGAFGYLTLERKIDEWLIPTVRIAGGRSEQRVFSDANGASDFTATMSELEACLIRLGNDFVSVRPCLFLMGGVVDASGRNMAGLESHARARWDLGTSLLFTMKVGSYVQIVTNSALIFPLRRDEYQFAPDVFFAVPAVGAIVGAGIGWQFL